MLLIFGGLDQKEQVSVFSSVNNTYDFDQIANAMRIQFPHASGKPVRRRDYLGCARGGVPRDSGTLAFCSGMKSRSLALWEKAVADLTTSLPPPRHMRRSMMRPMLAMRWRLRP